jgi:hypothetical protein
LFAQRGHKNLLWIIHDARSDAEALLAHAGGIRLNDARVFDTQVADLFLRRARGFISRLENAEKLLRERDNHSNRRAAQRALAKNPNQPASASPRDPSIGRAPQFLHGFARSLRGRVADAESLAGYKARGKDAMRGGDDGRVWMVRPIDPFLVEYAALDAGLAVGLYAAMRAELGAAAARDVEQLSRDWNIEWLERRVAEQWSRETAVIPRRLVELIDTVLLALREKRELLGKVKPKRI